MRNQLWSNGHPDLTFYINRPRDRVQRTREPLEGAPAVRHRRELRNKRFEIGFGASSTIGQDFYEATLATGRLSFHLTDWLAITGFGGFNLTKDRQTAVLDGLLQRLPASDPTDRTPTQAEATASMNKIELMAGGQVDFIPFSGKLSFVSKLFMDYHFYVFGGFGALNLVAEKSANECSSEAYTGCPITDGVWDQPSVLGPNCSLTTGLP